MVAIMDLCLAWIHDRRLLHLLDWTHRRNIPYLFPRRQQSIIRYLGLAMAGVQSCCYGLHLVRSAVMDWR